jgi:hypothetical protein
MDSPHFSALKRRFWLGFADALVDLGLFDKML